MRDVFNIRKCNDCVDYWLKDSTNYFKNVCSKPHLIVYAKLATYPYWPAKLMSINGNMANVEFFDEVHSQADVPVSKCRIYSEKLPERTPKSIDLTDGLKVKVVPHFS